MPNKRSFEDIFGTGGKSNSLGESQLVIESVLKDKSRLDELYACMHHEDSWVVMRAADTLEKIAREHPDWLKPYIDAMLVDFYGPAQASVQWHLAQIYNHVELTNDQRNKAVKWLKALVTNRRTDWIVSVQAMSTLVRYAEAGILPKNDVIKLLKIQLDHKSQAVVKKAQKFIDQLS